MCVRARAITCPDLSECLGDRLPALFREFMLPCEGVERRESLGGGGLAGRLGAADTEPRLRFLLDGGMSEEGSSAGTGSFSRARYTRCMALGGGMGGEGERGEGSGYTDTTTHYFTYTETFI